MYKDLKDRWKSKSPEFWIKLKWFAIKLGTASTAVLGADRLFGLQAYGIAPIVFTIAGYVIVVCATLGLSAQITKE